MAVLIPILLFIVGILSIFISYSASFKVSGNCRDAGATAGVEALCCGLLMIHPSFATLLCEWFEVPSKQENIFSIFLVLFGILVIGIGLKFAAGVILRSGEDSGEATDDSCDGSIELDGEDSGEATDDSCNDSIELDSEDWGEATDDSCDNTLELDDEDLICCPKCGKKNPADSAFCSSCGKKIVP